MENRSVIFHEHIKVHDIENLIPGNDVIQVKLTAEQMEKGVNFNPLEGDWLEDTDSPSIPQGSVGESCPQRMTRDVDAIGEPGSSPVPSINVQPN